MGINIFSGVQERRGASLFRVVGQPRPGVKLEDLEKAAYDEIESIKRDGITQQELDKVRIQFLRNQIQARSSSQFLANRIATLTVFYNDPNLINTAYDKFAAVTAEQVKQAAQKYLTPE